MNIPKENPEKIIEPVFNKSLQIPTETNLVNPPVITDKTEAIAAQREMIEKNFTDLKNSIDPVTTPLPNQLPVEPMVAPGLPITTSNLPTISNIVFAGLIFYGIWKVVGEPIRDWWNGKAQNLQK